MFRDLYNDIAHGSWGDRLTAILLVIPLYLFVAVGTLVALFLVGGLVFVAFDNYGTVSHQTEAVVLKKNFISSAVITSMVAVGNVSVPIVTITPELWQACVDVVPDTERCASVSEERYQALEIGDRVGVHYSIGRYSGDVYVQIP